MSEACDLSAVEARRLIGEKRLSPVELLDSCIQRIERVNPAVNAMVATCYDRARDEARKAEKAVMDGAALGPIHGLPVGIKDLNDTAGLRTTYGSLLFKDHIPAADEGVVAAVRRGGGIIVGKTNTPEFGAGANTTNRVYGPTGNPFDPKRTCGGSSGGSAVALATGMVPLATGSDTGGSLRTPASFCGVVGYRGSPGLVPSDKRTVGWTTYGVQGPMGRSVGDAALLLSAMAGDDRADPLSAPVDAASFRALEPLDLSTLRVAVSEDLGFAPVESGIRRGFQERVAKLRGLFRSCEEAHADFTDADRAFWLIRGVNFIASHHQKFVEKRELLGPNVASNVEAGLAMSAAEIGWAMAAQTRIYRRFHQFMKDFDLVICPAVSVPPFPVEQLYCGEIDGRKLDSYIHWVAITYGLTLAAAAVCVVPCGLDHTGTPYGLQVAGPRGADAFVLRAALALERMLETDPALRRPVPDVARLAGGR